MHENLGIQILNGLKLFEIISQNPPENSKSHKSELKTFPTFSHNLHNFNLCTAQTRNQQLKFKSLAFAICILISDETFPPQTFNFPGSRDAPFSPSQARKSCENLAFKLFPLRLLPQTVMQKSFLQQIWRSLFCINLFA